MSYFRLLDKRSFFVQMLVGQPFFSTFARLFMWYSHAIALKKLNKIIPIHMISLGFALDNYHFHLEKHRNSNRVIDSYSVVKTIDEFKTELKNHPETNAIFLRADLRTFANSIAIAIQEYAPNALVFALESEKKQLSDSQIKKLKITFYPYLHDPAGLLTHIKSKLKMIGIVSMGH